MKMSIYTQHTNMSLSGGVKNMKKKSSHTAQQNADI